MQEEIIDCAKPQTIIGLVECRIPCAFDCAFVGWNGDGAFMVVMEEEMFDFI